MKTTIASFIMLILCLGYTYAQSPQTYTNKREEVHLCGPLTIQDLQSAPYQGWFQENYDDFSLEDAAKWKKQLKDTQVDIYLGTWCGDSKYWVPRFIKLWDALGLDQSQLRLIALYDGSEQYKQGPNGEEGGKKIHRVPTFIFNQSGKEYARIVESPSTDLVTDLAQIALGYPSEPNYQAANYLMDLMEVQSIEDIKKNIKVHASTVYRKAQNPGELNTLGYVLLHAKRLDQALLAFEINTYLFPYYANTFDSYAEALALAGRTDEAIQFYNKVLELDGDNENALQQIERLKAG